MSFYMYLSSKDTVFSSSVNESNVFSDFTIELWNEHEFEDYERWCVALTDIYLEIGTEERYTLTESVIVLSDLVKSSYILGKAAPILRYIPVSQVTGVSLFQTYYIGIVKPRVKRIRIYLRNKNLEELSLDWPINSILKCTLHFMKI